jgi:hypothetical protein
MGKDSKPRGSDDLVFVYSKSEDGAGYQVLRQRKDTIEAGTLRPLERGKAIHGEVVQLKPRPESAALFDVEVQYSAGQSPDERPASAGGPPKVATAQYRKGWDSIWSSKAGSRMSN